MEVLFLWVGLLFLTIGALVIHAEAGARHSGVAVAGRIVGLSRPKGDTKAPYHAVAEFVGQDNQHRLNESAVGSSAPIGRVGDAVSILIRTGEPESAVFKSPATYFIGSILALLGAADPGAPAGRASTGVYGTGRFQSWSEPSAHCSARAASGCALVGATAPLQPPLLEDCTAGGTVMGAAWHSSKSALRLTVPSGFPTWRIRRCILQEPPIRYQLERGEFHD